jgi:protein-S-isoprenylcysteine O-methyltransferase Ste14
MISPGRILLAGAWIVWMYPFVFRAPHNQKRPSTTRKGATTVGLLLETAGICLAYAFEFSGDATEPWWRLVVAVVLCAVSCALAWGAVKHLGKQFRVNAGLYEDHELVRTGPYAIVRHPIYAALLGMLLATMVLITPWQWALISLILFIAGTEIRVRTEDRLLASRFPDAFAEYRRQVPAYVPFVR